MRRNPVFPQNGRLTLNGAHPFSTGDWQELLSQRSVRVLADNISRRGPGVNFL